MTNQAQGKPWDGHTPLPWEYDDSACAILGPLRDDEYADERWSVVNLYSRMGGKDTNADVALIVERVNKGPAADAMAEAVEAILGQLGAGGYLVPAGAVLTANLRQALAAYRESVS